jgi:gas vesicle protein
MNGEVDRGLGVMTGVFIGALMGAGLALLLAPATGPETRRKFAETARRVADGLNNVVEQTKSRLGQSKDDNYEPVASGAWEATSKTGY